MSTNEQKIERLHIQNARLSKKGRETLDPKPKVAYAQINPETGEVLRDGKMPPRSLAETIAAATSRNFPDVWYEGDEDDSDFNAPDDSDPIPTLSPHQEGFVDAMGISVEAAVKTLQKRGYSVLKHRQAPDEPDSPSESKKKARASKAGEPSTPLEGESE